MYQTNKTHTSVYIPTYTSLVSEWVPPLGAPEDSAGVRNEAGDVAHHGTPRLHELLVVALPQHLTVHLVVNGQDVLSLWDLELWGRCCFT